MCRSLLIVFLFFSSIQAISQTNELIYKKLIPATSHQLVSFPDGSGYVILYFFSAYTPSVTDVGIFSETPVNYVFNDTVYKNAIAIYDNDFSLVDIFYYTSSNLSTYGAMGFGTQIFPVSNLNTILYFSFSAISSFGNTGILSPTMNFLSDTPLQCMFIKTDPITETTEKIFTSSLDNFTSTLDLEPYTGYWRASNDVSLGTSSTSSRVAAILGDSILIAYLSLVDAQTIYSSVDTQPFNSMNGQINMIRATFNLNSGELLSAEQIGSPTGNLTVFTMEPSKDMEGLFRAGLVRGNDTPVSISGNELEMPPNDSLYHVFITKENTAGETQWLAELYAYNNSLSDTVMFVTPTTFSTRNRFLSIVEMNNEVFVTTSEKAIGEFSDTLLYKNYLGEESLYNNYIPDIQHLSLNYQILYSQKAIYKLDENGNVAGVLSHTNKLSAYEALTHSLEVNQDLYEISDKLAWINSYYALNDSLGKFTLKDADGNETYSYVNFPAGNGEYILWLDTDLNIIDHWIIPYQSQNNFHIGGMKINSILNYSGDTLMIHGLIHSLITTNLDPFGNAPLFTSNVDGSFFALYAAPDIFTTTSEKNRNKIRFKVFPNPTNGILHISGIDVQNCFYTVFDISGRAVMSGRLNTDRQINTERLRTGMYILSIKSEQGIVVEKFVVG